MRSKEKHWKSFVSWIRLQGYLEYACRTHFKFTNIYHIQIISKIFKGVSFDEDLCNNVFMGCTLYDWTTDLHGHQNALRLWNWFWFIFISYIFDIRYEDTIDIGLISSILFCSFDLMRPKIGAIYERTVNFVSKIIILYLKEFFLIC